MQSLPWGILGGDCLQREANLSQARFPSRLFCASSRHLGYVLDWEAEPWLWEHSWWSYKLLLLMAMSPGPVCVSICTPDPCPLPGAWHSTCDCPRGSCQFGARSSLVHTVFLPLLLATSASILFLSVLECLSPSGYGRWWEVKVISVPVFPAWLYPVGHEVVQ